MTLKKMTFSIPLAGLLLAGLTGCSEQSEPVKRPAPQVPQTPPAPPKVLQFYASPGVVERGEPVTMCYGVENAKSVSIDPNVRTLKASWNRCFTLWPSKTTTYKLTAVGDGGEVSAELVVKVRMPVAPPSRSPITMFTTSDEEVSKGQPVTLCYGLEEARALRIDPPVRELEPVSGCFTLILEETTTFILVATGEDGREHQAEATVRVK